VIRCRRARGDVGHVTDSIESALEQARRAAGGKDVSLAGGANAAGQYLAAGLVDDLHGLELVQTIAAPGVTHMKLARR
jgi:dihydrofolate reductase